MAWGDVASLINKAPVFFCFRPHVLIVHLGIFDLQLPPSDPLALADVSMVLAYVRSFNFFASGPFPAKVIFIAQPQAPRAVAQGHIDASVSCLLWRVDNSLGFSFILKEDFLGGVNFRAA